MIRLLTASLLALSAAALSAQVPLQKTLVAQGLQRPVWLGSPPGDVDRLFACEQHAGRVVIVDARRGVLAQPFLDLGSAAVAQNSEGGLLGLAFHPDYATNGFFYLNYTRASDGSTVVERYRVSAGNPDVADPASASQVLVVGQPRAWHNAGALQFGPDGYLYIALGDGGGDGCRGQLGTTLLGKLLRIDVDSAAPYAIPPGNPFVGLPNVREEIFHGGLRNPWRFSFDRGTGDLYVADVGWQTQEEVSWVAAGSPGGVNFGWGQMEGTACQLSCPGPACNTGALRLPLHTYLNRATGQGDGCAIIGGHVYRGCDVPELDGRYFFGDLCSGRIWSLRGVAGQATDLREHTADLNPPGQTTIRRISTFGEDARGELYIAELNAGDIWRIGADAPGTALALGGGKVGSNGQVPRFDVCGPVGSGRVAEASLALAPPLSPALLVFAAASQPVALPFGTVLANPAIASISFVTDTQGRVALPLRLGFDSPQQSLVRPLFLQWLLLDPPVTGGVGISNAYMLRVW